ncbi:hypothetical protein NPIL_597251 [Nephila pilipes]|uniref:Uncharacterized protein n=1 Tax=Nephila pilipes TaxID=299642 RepID=A0A8X6Q8D8_NEPPI|nr:hypothetical protein NPIL_597251 [Nephila pilipes]
MCRESERNHMGTNYKKWGGNATLGYNGLNCACELKLNLEFDFKELEWLLEDSDLVAGCSNFITIVGTEIMSDPVDPIDVGSNRPQPRYQKGCVALKSEN